MNNDELCIANDELCFENHDFCILIDDLLLRSLSKTGEMLWQANGSLNGTAMNLTLKLMNSGATR